RATSIIWRRFTSRLTTPRSTPALEEELTPRRPPIVPSRDDLPRLRDLDAGAVPVLLDVVRGVEVDGDLRRRARVVRCDGPQVGERALRAGLDQLTRPRRRVLTRAE